MTRSERFPWLRRDGGPFAISLILHVLLLLLLAPWLVMRTIPDTQVEVEVMLEPDTQQTPRSRPEQTALLKGPAKALRPLDRPLPRPVQMPTVETARTRPEPQTPPLATTTPAAETGQGQTGSSAPAPREVAGLSAPNSPGQGSAAEPASAGATALQPASEQTSPQAPRVPATREAGALSAMKNPDVRISTSPLLSGPSAWQRGSEEAGPVAPRAPSVGSTPQPSARAAAAPSRPGEDRQDGPITLAGPAAQVQSAQPEFRQAARQGGQVSMRGGSKAPSDGLASQAGLPEHISLLAARAVPLSQPGSGATPGGQAPAMAAPAARSSGQGGAAAGEIAASSLAPSTAPASGTRSGSVAAAKVPTLATPAARSSSGQGSSVASENTDSSLAQAASTGTRSEAAPAGPAGPAPTLAAPATRISNGQGSAVASESAGSGLVPSAAPASGPAPAIASRAPITGGQTSAGTGSGNRTASPTEQGRGGLMAAATQAEPGTGTGQAGGGPGASEAGQGRSQVRGGTGSAAQEAASPLLAAAGSATAAQAGTDVSAGQLSGRAETVALAQSASEAHAAKMQLQKPTGQARVIEERFSASTLKVDSPSTICHLPLMFAGLDRMPIPQGLDSINSTAARLQDETPPRHFPTNQAPRYPLAGVAMRAQGRVLVRAEIRADGSIGQRWIKQSSGLQLLDLAALETVNGWRFYPAQRHGMAVAVWIDVPIEYKLP
jgi:TonB family protein